MVYHTQHNVRKIVVKVPLTTKFVLKHIFFDFRSPRIP